MTLKLRERLLSGFLGVALLVLLTGGIGIYLIEEVSETANHALEEKVPLQDTAGLLLASIGHTIGLAKEYVLNLDVAKRDRILKKLDDESINIERWLQALDSPLVEQEHHQVAETYQRFTKSLAALIQAHDQRMPFWFRFDGRLMELKGFVMEERIALNVWLQALEESARFDSAFSGNLDPKKDSYMRWHQQYQTDDPKLKKLLDKYAKIKKKTFKFATKVDKAKGNRKLSHYQRGESRQVVKANKRLDQIVRYVTPVVERAAQEEIAALEKMSRIDAEIEHAVHVLREVVEHEMEAARIEVLETQKFAWNALMLAAVIGVVLAIVVALLIARSVVKPVNCLKHMMSQVSKTGDFSQRAQDPSDDEVGEMAKTYNTLLDSLQEAIGEIGEVMAASAGGDFGRRIQSDLAGDLGMLKQSVNDSVESIQGAIGRVNGVMQAVEAGDFDQRVEEQFGGELQTFRNTVNGALNSLQQMTERLGSVMGAIVDGNFSHRMQGDGESEIEQGVNRAMESMETIIGRVSGVMESVAEGDISRSIDGDYPGALGALTASVNTSLVNQREIVGDVRSAAQTILNRSGEIAKGNSALSKRTTEQAASLEETAANMEEMAGTVKMNADNAAHATQLSTEANQQAESGAEIVNDAVVAMGRINEASNKISEIITLIHWCPNVTGQKLI